MGCLAGVATVGAAKTRLCDGHKCAHSDILCYIGVFTRARKSVRKPGILHHLQCTAIPGNHSTAHATLPTLLNYTEKLLLASTPKEILDVIILFGHVALLAYLARPVNGTTLVYPAGRFLSHYYNVHVHNLSMAVQTLHLPSCTLV